MTLWRPCGVRGDGWPAISTLPSTTLTSRRTQRTGLLCCRNSGHAPLGTGPRLSRPGSAFNGGELSCDRRNRPSDPVAPPSHWRDLANAFRLREPFRPVSSNISASPLANDPLPAGAPTYRTAGAPCACRCAILRRDPMTTRSYDIVAPMRCSWRRVACYRHPALNHVDVAGDQRMGPATDRAALFRPPTPRRPPGANRGPSRLAPQRTAGAPFCPPDAGIGRSDLQRLQVACGPCFAAETQAPPGIGPRLSRPGQAAARRLAMLRMKREPAVCS
jgi:hypothetical protein